MTARVRAAREAPLSQLALEHDFRNFADNPAIRTVDAQLQPGSRAGEASLLLTGDPPGRWHRRKALESA